MPKKKNKFIPRTNAQNKALHSLLSKHGFDADSKAEMVYFYTDGRTERSSEMSFDEANRMIHKLGGQPFTATPSISGKSRRAVNLKNQKAGIKSIVSPTHIDLMNRLWRLRDGRTPEGLKALSQRIIRKDKPATSTECNKVIEAIKSMNSRDNALSFPKQQNKGEAA